MFADELEWPDPDPVSLDKLDLPVCRERAIGIEVLRLDKIHPVISGNKWFKLREHLQIACAGNFRHIVTFGGAWSNHIVATAFACRLQGIPCTGFIRGDEPVLPSQTLRAAGSYGMQIEFISRDEYRRKEEPAFAELLRERHPASYIVPEGGGGSPGIRGSAAIGQWTAPTTYTHLLCAVGTGTMFRGLATTLRSEAQLIGVPVLKGLDRLPPGWMESIPDPSIPERCRLEAGYHFGRYARKTGQLLEFMRAFYDDTGIPTDFVYTAKLCFAVLDMAAKGCFAPGSRLLVIHSGGLQGNLSLPPGSLNF